MGAQYDVEVVLDETVVLAALHEQLPLGRPGLFPFPPSDPRMPASTALATAASDRVRAARIMVVLPVSCLDRALAQARQSHPHRAADLARFRQESAQQLGEHLEDFQQSHTDADTELNKVITVVRPDMLVTTHPRRLRTYGNITGTVRPGDWVRAAVNAIRVHPGH